MKEELNLINLNRKELSDAKGGTCTTPNCNCACWYSGCGGSATMVNCGANASGHLASAEMAPSSGQ